jgi:pimeloyl-ACP methyl ester carboxylesterase
MFATPAAVLGVWFRGLVALGLLALSGWMLHEWSQSLPRPAAVVVQDESPQPPQERRATFPERLRQWRPGFDRPTAMLSGSLLLFAWSFGGGRLLSRRMLRPSDGTGIPVLKPGETHRLKRPDGTELHLEIHGPASDTTVILTHGWGTNSREWSYLMREWGNRFRVIVWDLPGLGRSTRPSNNDYLLEKMAEDLKAVIEFSGEGEVVLVGHSIGGMIMLTLSKLHPELIGSRVQRMVIAHSSYTNPLRTAFLGSVLKALENPVIKPLLYLQIGLSPLVWLMNWMSYLNGSIHNSLGLTGFAGTESREQLDFVASFSPRESPAVLARGCLGMCEYDASNVLKEISVPVVVFSGDRDPVTLPAANRHMAGELLHGRLHPLNPGRHYGLIEHNADFAGATAAHVASLRTDHGTRQLSR